MPCVAQVRRFAECQRRRKQWLNFAWIADWCARASGNIKPDEGNRMAAFQQLYAGALGREFERYGKSMLLFLGPDRDSNGRWSRNDLAKAVHAAGGEIDRDVAREILACCWVPNAMAQAWMAARNIGLAPHLCPTGPSPKVSRNFAETETQRGPPRADYREADAPLIAEMHRKIADGSAKNATDAARGLCDQAIGMANSNSKVTRLVRHYYKEYPKPDA